jgi:PAS domain S-box-containing protein
MLTVLIQQVCKAHDVSWQSEDQQMMDAFNDAVVLSSDTGIIIGCNQPALQLFKYTKNTFIGKPLTVLMPSDVGAKHDAYLNNYFATGIKRLIGKPRYVEYSKQA